MSNTFWFTNPKILVDKDKIRDFWPLESMSSDEKLNAISRLVIILTILGFLITKTVKIIITGVVTLGCIILLKYVNSYRNKENIIKKIGSEAFSNPEYYKLVKDNFQEPKENNPAMNVLLTDISEHPDRLPAAPSYNPIIEKKMNDSTKEFVEKNFNDPNIDEKLFKDLGDNFIFDQSMRTWYATPSTTIPNDQGSFAEFCYGDMKSCKEGNEFACTQSMPPHWINGNN